MGYSWNGVIVMDKLVLVDIDGFLTDYPGCFLKWVSYFKKKEYYSIDEMKDSLSTKEYEDIKEAYRCSGIKRELSLNPFCRELLMICWKMGFIIWIVTTRPEREPIKSDTIYWLNRNIHYDSVFFVEDKKAFISSIKGYQLMMIMDDELDKIIMRC
jgi:hypothetical protein